MPSGHVTTESPAARTSNHVDCGGCTGRILLVGQNDLATISPVLAAELHPTKNGTISATTLTIAHPSLLFWLCDKGHTYRRTIKSRLDGNGCTTCSRTRRLASLPTLAAGRPDLARQWHPIDNGTLTADDVTLGSKKSVGWLCDKGHSYPQIIERRVVGYGCSICHDRKLEPGVNDRLSRQPLLCTEWHSYLNGTKSPDKMLPGTDSHWWKCRAANHTTRQSVPHRIKSGGCTDCPPDQRILNRN
jgi:hypothetical protein